MELYLKSPNTPSYCVAQLKHRDRFTFTLPYLNMRLYGKQIKGIGIGIINLKRCINVFGIDNTLMRFILRETVIVLCCQVILFQFISKTYLLQLTAKSKPGARSDVSNLKPSLEDRIECSDDCHLQIASVVAGDITFCAHFTAK
jgi:hypothetical protein